MTVQPYRPRPVRFLRLARVGGWRVKTYGVSAHAEWPDPALVDAALALADRHLPRPAVAPASALASEVPVSTERYGVAIVIAHEGLDGAFALVSWWTGENMLAHHAFVAPGPPYAFRPLAPTGIVACVWELAVLAFERGAWVETVLANPAGPDLDAYLARRLEADV